MANGFRAGATTDQLSASTITVTKPAGVQDGDVMWAVIANDDAVVAADPNSVPSGWINLGRALSTNIFRTVLYRKVASGEGASYQWGSSAASLYQGEIQSYSGVDNGTPEDVATVFANGNSASIDCPSITTITDNAWQVTIATSFAGNTLTKNAAYTEDIATHGSSGDLSRTDHKNISPAGASGVHSVTNDVPDVWCAISIAVRPAATGVSAVVGKVRIASRRVGPAVLRFKFRAPFVLQTPAPDPVTTTPSLLKIANKKVGPAVLRFKFRPPFVFPVTTPPDPANNQSVLLKIANRNVGPTILRRLFRWPYVPAVPQGAPVVVTPGVAILTLATFAPSVTATQNVTVTPSTASLVLTAFASTVFASDNKSVTPGKGTLILTTFAPSISIGQNVTAGVASLVLTAFAPTVTLNIIVTPGTKALTLTRFAPTVVVNNIVIPGVASLVLSAFAPTVTTTNHKSVFPGAASLVLTGFAPTVSISGQATPGAGRLPIQGVG